MSIIKVLIVEDESMIALNLKETLEDLNYKVIGIASNKSKLIKLLEEIKSIDIILMDINLKEDYTGIDIAKELKTSYPNIPIIFLTANSDVSIIKSTSDTISYGYIIKPYRIHNLQASIELAIEKHKKYNMEMLNLTNAINKKKILEDILKSKNISNQKILNLLEPYMYDKENKALFYNGKKVDLTNNENIFIDILCNNIHCYISQEAIENIIWKEYFPGNNAFRSLVFRLRGKIDKDLVLNRKGLGYCINLGKLEK